jgi:hypothetical protein
VSGAVESVRGTVESLMIEWLKVASQKAVGEQMYLSWGEIHGMMERAVEVCMRACRKRFRSVVRARRNHLFLAAIQLAMFLS